MLAAYYMKLAAGTGHTKRQKSGVKKKCREQGVLAKSMEYGWRMDAHYNQTVLLLKEKYWDGAGRDTEASRKGLL